MKCPICDHKVSEWASLRCSKGNPCQCESCGARLWTNRVLSKGLLGVLWYSGIGVLVLFITFIEGLSIGLAVLLGFSVLHFAVAKLELWVLGFKVIEDRESHNKAKQAGTR